jgi:hypothetical protein
MKYKEQRKGNKVKRGSKNNLTPGAFGKAPKAVQIDMRILPRSRRNTKST